VAIPVISITGKVLDPGAVGVTGGTLTAKLSQPGSVLDGATSQRVGAQVTTTFGAGGVLSGFSLVPNDAITPSGTYYTFRYSALLADGTRATWMEMAQLASSPSTIDIGAVPRLGVVPGQAVGSDVSAATVTPTGSTTARVMKDLAAMTLDHEVTVAGEVVVATFGTPGAFSSLLSDEGVAITFGRA
jgi:hypothetical protein